MGETTVVTHLFVLGITAIIINSGLLVFIACINVTVGYFDFLAAMYPTQYQSFAIGFAVFSFILFLFALAYAIVTIIGSILGFLYKDCMRKIGAIMLILINLILIPFFVVNCFFVIAAFKEDSIVLLYQHAIILSASLSAALCVFQCGLFVYSICHIIVICKSFRYINRNRQAEEYQENERDIAIQNI